MKVHFEEFADTKADVDTLRGMLGVAVDFLQEMVRYGWEILEVCTDRAKTDGRHCHRTILAMARQQLVYADDISVLLRHGCVEGSMVLLRPTLEAYLGIAHICREHHYERALAYEYARVRQMVKKFEIGDKTHTAGQRLAAELAGDVHTPHILDHMPKDLHDKVNAVEWWLNRHPEFVPIIAEWDRIKAASNGSKEPEWYRLFGGGRTIRDLAKQLGQLSQYVFIYKDLSDTIHAGNALDCWNVDRDDLDARRPLRHPWAAHRVLSGVMSTFVLNNDVLLGFYDTAQQQSFRTFMVASVVPRQKLILDHLKQLPKWHTSL